MTTLTVTTKMDPELVGLLTKAVARDVSDIHITSGKAPAWRLDGSLRHLKEPVLSPIDTERMVRSLLSSEDWDTLQMQRELDFSAQLPGVSRFRVNAFYRRGSLSLAIRVITDTIPSIESLSLPPVIKEITNETQGLVLVTGPTGSGKSSTLAAMIDYINQRKKYHIITLEDPIEYMHSNKRSLIDQREVGEDTPSFISGLRASLRQDPDVILVGELRDLETISTAVTAAETGHLVFGTLHTRGAVSTIERMIGMFPPEQQTQIRMQIAMSLRAVISQQLVPLKGGSGRRAITEIMVNTPAIRNLINTNKSGQIQSTIQTSKASGMHTMSMDAKRLVREGVIDRESVEELVADLD